MPSVTIMFPITKGGCPPKVQTKNRCELQTGLSISDTDFPRPPFV